MRTVDREISWLNFNYRCLHMAMRDSIPFLERLNFLGITFSNMSEFVAVRFSSVIEGFLSAGKVVDDLGNSNFDKKYENLLPAIMKFKEKQYDVYVGLRKKLQKKLGVDLIDDYEELSKKEAEWCDNYFDDDILPVLTPITYDSTKELPIMADNEVQFLLKLSDRHGASTICFMAVPSHIERIVKLSKSRFILVEEIIERNLKRLFVGKKVEGYIQFKTYKFVRNVSSDENEFILDRVRKYLSERDFTNHTIFLDVRYKKKHTDLIKVLYKLMDVYKGHVFTTKHPLRLECLSKRFYHSKKYEYEPFKPQVPSDLIGEKGILDYLSRDDILLHHPYDSFDLVVDFVKEAARDDKVISIKQTLYRVSSNDSQLIQGLCEASRRGKKVIVMLELKARFNERQNVALIETLKDAGCTLIYGLERFKVHAKMCLVTRKAKKGLKIFAHVGTGNYNESTAKVYTDISFMTSNDKIGKDLNDVFNMISGFSFPKAVEHVYFSPKGIRKRIFELIDREVKNVRKGGEGHVVLKMNGLCDLKTIKKINEAAEEGVIFNIICRGICSLVPKKNIRIKSIVGRYLEHSRIYYFDDNGHPTVLIASADLMTRNLDNRVEIMVPIKDSTCKKRLIDILKTCWKDEANTYWMTENKDYVKEVGDRDAHKIFMKKSAAALKVPKKEKKW